MNICMIMLFLLLTKASQLLSQLKMLISLFNLYSTARAHAGYGMSAWVFSLLHSEYADSKNKKTTLLEFKLFIVIIYWSIINEMLCSVFFKAIAMMLGQDWSDTDAGVDQKECSLLKIYLYIYKSAAPARARAKRTNKTIWK